MIIHTGDFKVDPTPTDNELFDLHTLAEYGKRGVLLLLSDSTNADRPGYTETERAVRPRMEELFNRAEQPRWWFPASALPFTAFNRFSTSPQEYGRRWRSSGRSMLNVTEIAHSSACWTSRTAFCCGRRTSCRLPPDKVAVLVSGTQGEPMSALSRVAVDNHKHLSVETGDTVVLSSRIIPGQREGHLPHDQPHSPSAARM